MRILNVGVFMGGKGGEREVSLNSGRTICDHLDTARYNVLPIFQDHHGKIFLLPWRFLHRGKISDFEHRLEHEAEHLSWEDLKSRIDFLYIAAHGRYAEDGTLQGLLEILEIPYLGSKVFSSALGMNKALQKIFLTSNNIETPKSILLSPTTIKNSAQEDVESKLASANLSFPLVVKPSHEGSSLGVSVVNSTQELHTALIKAMQATPLLEQEVLVEEFIRGMEFSCIILTDYKNDCLIALPPTEIVLEKNSQFFDYEQKYMPGRATKFTPARCSEDSLKRIKDTCIKAMKALEMNNLARIDGFLTADGRVVIIDPNTLSGMGPASYIFTQAAEINMSHTALINHLIETELHAYGLLENIMTHSMNNQLNAPKAKLRVAVLMGGRSNEREISLESGRNITYKLSPHSYEVMPIFVDSKLDLYRLNQRLLVRNSTAEIEADVSPLDKIAWSKLPEVADFVFLALHGGQGEDGTIQGALEMLGIPYNGSGVLASSICMDKFKTKKVLQSCGLDTPQGILVEKKSWELSKQIELPADFPLIVKPHDDGCSVMVQKVHTHEQLNLAIDAIFSLGKEYALIEECITGMELTVGVIGNDKPQALPPSRAVATGDILSITEKFLPGAGENQTPAPLPPAILQLVQKTMEAVYEKLGCKGYARIDCFYQPQELSPTGKERIVTIEVNTLPGMTPATCIFHQAAEIGIKAMDFVDLIIQLGLELHRKERFQKNNTIAQQNL